MAIKSKEELKYRPIEIDLSGPEGNVFHLMAYANRLSRQLWDAIEEDAAEDILSQETLAFLLDEEFESPKTMGEYIRNKMMESDYENAIQVFDRYFGGIVTLYR